MSGNGPERIIRNIFDPEYSEWRSSPLISTRFLGKDAFGALFRDPADSKAPKLEGEVLQEPLNDLGSRSHDDWDPLKVDNWIGPKTTDALGKMLRTEAEARFRIARHRPGHRRFRWFAPGKPHPASD